MKEYKIGDVIFINPTLKLGDGDFYVGTVSGMLVYKGRKAVITNKVIEFARNTLYYSYKIDIDGERYYWTSSMFTKAIFDKNFVDLSFIR